MNNYAQQPAIESMPVAKQPMASSTMSKWTLYERKSTVTWDKRQCDANSPDATQTPPATREQTDETLRLRGGCPGKRPFLDR
jgi:hypothetical protein